MKSSSYFTLACSIVSALALGVPSLSSIESVVSSLIPRRAYGVPRTPIQDIAKRAAGDACPAVWFDVSKNLTGEFMKEGNCNDNARAAIRAAFHDCGAWNTSLGDTGGCDGSLILAPEFPRPENRGLETIAEFLLQRARAFNVSAADMIVFAANHATRSCAKGPLVPTWVGRNDSSVAAPTGLLPSGKESADEIIALFEAKGLIPRELVALVGAHSTAKQRFFDPSPARAEAPQDSTPEIWDTNFYKEAVLDNPPANVLIFDSDRHLAMDNRTSGTFVEFQNQRDWNGAYMDAMLNMTLLGVPGRLENLVDCTEVLKTIRG